MKRTAPLNISTASARFLLALVLGAGGAWASEPNVEEAVNPHERKDQCRQCHRHDPPEAIGVGEIYRICVGCHDGLKAPAEAHPVGRQITGTTVRVPVGWPVPDDRVTCLTCHDPRQACPRLARTVEVGSDFLRPVSGDGRNAFCFTCHERQRFVRFNPHRMVGPDGKVRQQSCRLCHTRALPRDTGVRRGEAHLYTAPSRQCITCHPTHVKYYDPGHIGDRIEAPMLAYMAAVEQSPPGVRVTPRRVREFRQEHRRPRRRPLGSNDTILCTSCHNPHQAKVFPPGSVLADRAMRITGAGRVISPVRSRDFCLGCHNK